MKALVLGGGKCNVALFSVTKERYKSRIRLKDVPMIEYVIKALLSSKLIDSVDVYTEKHNEGKLPNNNKIKRHSSSRNPIENILDFIHTYGDELKDSPFLICTSDLPLLRPKIVDDFINKSLESKKKFVIPIVRKNRIVRKFPLMKRTYINIDNEEWCGGNIFLIEKDFFIRNIRLARSLFKNRKSILKSGNIFGWRLVFRLLLKKLSFRFIEEETKKRFGGAVLPLIFNSIEVCIDVDKVSDYFILKDYMEKKDF